jgi:hypothetical protein
LSGRLHIGYHQSFVGDTGITLMNPITPRYMTRGHLPDDWDKMSFVALWNYLNPPRRTPRTTIEAVMYAVRERGVAALREAANIERLPGLLGAITARAEAQTVRLALTYALLDSKDQTPPHSP